MLIHEEEEEEEEEEEDKVKKEEDKIIFNSVQLYQRSIYTGGTLYNVYTTTCMYLYLQCWYFCQRSGSVWLTWSALCLVVPPGNKKEEEEEIEEKEEEKEEKEKEKEMIVR